MLEGNLRGGKIRKKSRKEGKTGEGKREAKKEKGKWKNEKEGKGKNEKEGNGKNCEPRISQYIYQP